VAVAVGSIVGAVAVGVLLVVFLNKPSPPPPPPPPPRQTVAAPRPDPEPQKKLVRWEISTQPPGAKIIRLRDGEILGATPFSLSNPSGSGTETLRIVKEGYLEEAVTLDLARDYEQKIDLKRKSGRDGKRNKTKRVPGDLTILD
jgi:hypothetical protein